MLTGQRQKREWWSYFVQDWALILPNFATWAWRYGLVETPLGQSFLTDGTLWAGGDWCCGPKVQDAWRSGTDIAANILNALESSLSVRSAVAN
jgi:predicted NAD/FAD-dependent oxidoreductase